MLFGRSSQQQGQTAQPAAGYGAESTGANPAAQQNSPWTGGNGYPAQPAGTGYAGYTPGAQPFSGTGYAQSQSGYTSQTQNGYAAQGQNGYAASGYNGYNSTAQSYGQTGAQLQGGYAQPQAGYAVQPQGYAQAAGYQQQSYAMPQGYGQAAQGYAQPGQSAAQPQGGYTYPQMNAGGYNAQTGYAAGYNAFAQMGRNQQAPQGQPQDYSRQIPLNGGGYVPPPVPVRKQPFEFKSWMLIALGAVLALLCAAGLFIPGMAALKWIFIALALVTILLFWIRPLIGRNQRLCYTIIFGALALVALVSALGVLSPRTDNTRTPASTAQATARPADVGNGGSVIDPETGNAVNVVSEAQATATPTPVVEDTATVDRLESFFRYWAANRQDEMLTLCSPSWQSSVDNPKTALFGLMANRTPLDYSVEKVSGTVDDTSRTVTVVSTMDRNNGKDPVKYRLGVLMVKEGDQWFVDPQSLKTYEEADTPDPSITEAPTPTAEPLVNAATVLYYNPDGGSKYHLDPNCKSTHAKFLPFKGHFTYGEVNDDKYKDLSPCNVCGAPLRP